MYNYYRCHRRCLEDIKETVTDEDIVYADEGTDNATIAEEENDVAIV